MPKPPKVAPHDLPQPLPENPDGDDVSVGPPPGWDPETPSVDDTEAE